MSSDLPDELREYIRIQDEELACRADNFWRSVTPILNRQSNPNSNENGYVHVKMVEHNAWRLIKGADKAADFDPYELFILSCAACSHDFDKGLFDKLPDGVEHGQGSGGFILKEYEALQKSFPEMVAIKKIIGIHDFPDGRFQEELKNVERSYPLSNGPVNLQMLAVILKTADILHTDNSRIASMGIDTTTMSPKEMDKHLARESISGWDIDGSRIIINAVPKTHDHLSAFEGCQKHIKEKEWPAVAEKLQDYGFSFDLEFKMDTSICGDPSELNENALDKIEQAGDKYSQDNDVFNVPYREKGEGVVGREHALQQLHKKLTESRGTAIGQTASFYGMGGLGKTQLAVEYAHRFKNKYPNGVIWINADQEIDPQLIHIAKKCNWIASESEHKLILQIAKRRLRTYSDCLIIFDNVNQLEDIKPYLPDPHATPHLILTSRQPQPGFQPIEIDILNEKESLALLIMESGRHFDSLSLEEKNAAKNITLELGGLPLALEIAGAYLKYLSSLSFEKYLSILKENPSSALPGEMLSSFTSHESDLYRTLKVSESVFEQAPLLKDILNILTWSGSSFMGISLLSAMLDVDENRLFLPLSFGAELRLLRKDEAHDRYEIHRLLRTIRQEELALAKNREWAENICIRIGSWFEKRREDFDHLAEYEFEIDHLKQWYQNSEKIKSIQNARLLWLQAHPSYHWGNYSETFKLVKLALDLYEKNPEETIELKSNILNDLGAVYNYLGDHKKAMGFHEHSLEIRKKQLGPEHPHTATSLNNIGSTHDKLGDHNKALEFQVRALEIRERQLGPEHPDTATSLNSIGSIYGKLGDHKKALEFHERALEIKEKQLGPEHPHTATSLNNIGLTYDKLGDHKKALEFHERALEIREKQLGPEHPDTAASLNNVIFAYCKVKKFSDADNLLNKYLKVLPKEHPDYNDLFTLKDHIKSESIKSGFRPPSSKKTHRKKKKRKR